MGFENILFADERCKIMNENMKIRNFKKTGDLSVLPAFDIDLLDFHLPDMPGLDNLPDLPTLQ